MVKSTTTDTWLVHIYLPLTYVQILDGLVREGYYASRSMAVRVAVCDLIRSEKSLLKSSSKNLRD